MGNQFGFIDIILLAMFAGFIILRLRNILGRKTGHQGKPMGGYFPKGMEVLKDIDLMKNFLVTGIINKNPTKSVKNPGIIRSKAAKANAAPDIISYMGISFFTN